MPIIEVKHVTKEYNLGAVTSIKDSIRHSLAKLQGKSTWQRERFKALNDIDFSIKEGEVVGIIGHNGAGKSTLLKHLANITQPTSGEVIVRGSIAPLIEVGAGVNPELTGRENIFLNGAILGMPKKAIQNKLDEIIEFSELEQFIDTPVKRYSSGMTVKLGFSIATSMDADILIIDEVLAVGDLAFQRKCFDRMEHLIKKQGKTVLLVSHNIRQINRMCDRVILLDHGTVTSDGDPIEVSNQFYEENNQRILDNIQKNKQQELATDLLEITDLAMISETGEQVERINSGDPLRVDLKLKLKKDIERPEIVIGTHTTDFVYLTASSTELNTPSINVLKAGEHRISLTHANFPMKPGVYGVRVAIFDSQRNSLYSGENLMFFTVNQSKNEAKEPPSRLINTESSWLINQNQV